jgi:hypothetical protein
MVVESGAGCVSILREMYKRALLMDSVVNLLACAKHQEWQVSLKYRNCMFHFIFLFMRIRV